MFGDQEGEVGEREGKEAWGKRGVDGFYLRRERMSADFETKEGKNFGTAKWEQLAPIWSEDRRSQTDRLPRAPVV